MSRALSPAFRIGVSGDGQNELLRQLISVNAYRTPARARICAYVVQTPPPPLPPGKALAR